MFIFKQLLNINLVRPSAINRCAWSSSSNKFLNDDVSLCVIGNGAEGNPRSVFFNYLDRIFMFNCSEGLQRLMADFGFKSSKIETFFTTSKQWSNVSGLASLLLSRYDAGCKDFNVHNSSNETLIQQCTVFDTKLKRIKFRYLEANPLICEKLTITAVPIDFEDNQTVIYLGSLSPEKGKINLEKCFHAKVPRSLVSQLEQNQCVANQDGEIIQPVDVCDPDYPEQNFMIFECFKPKNYFENLLKNPIISRFIPRCEVFVHFTRDEYLSSPAYRKFLDQSSKSSKHLMITERNPSLSLPSTNRFQIQLNYLDPELFPLLRESNDLEDQSMDPRIIYSKTNLKYVFRSPEYRPSCISLDRTPQLSTLADALLYKDGEEREGIKEMQSDLQTKQASLQKSNSVYPEFVFLGTASSLSLPIRNVSVILVNLDEQQSILVECGENAYGQLLNFYGEKRIVEVLKKIKAVFISHHHSDHHMGLIQFLDKHRQHCPPSTSNDKLWLLLPPMVHKFLKSNQFFSLNRLNYHLVANQYFDSFRSKILDNLNVGDIDLIPVNHCAYAFGISLVDKHNFKFVYSGDTQPSDRLIERGRNCNLLIHEATVEDGLSQFARTHFHSTMSEAIQVGRSMRAGFILLTHFSQRYGKLPFLPDEQNSKNVGLAFDNMRLRPNQLDRVPLLHEPLKCMYAKHLDRLKYRSDLYQRKYGT